jgi:hypothetical protein
MQRLVFLSLIFTPIIFSQNLAFSENVLHLASQVTSANLKAEVIAKNSERVMRNLKELKKEAQKIRDVQMRKDALEILDTPRFLVVKENSPFEEEIKQKLILEGLLTDENKALSLFPKNSAMPFIAAPASPWRIHHTYPGGLVYHTLTNLKSALAQVTTYSQVYGLKLDGDLLRLATIWHDCAKTIVLAWNDDGSASDSKAEGQIAGTGRHHILGIAEAIVRNYPAKFIVILASAHTPDTPHAGHDELIKYLKASAIIARRSYLAAGLNEKGLDLMSKAPIESYIHHISDHDWIVTQVSLTDIINKFESDKISDFWEQDKILSKNGDLPLYQSLENPQ